MDWELKQFVDRMNIATYTDVRTTVISLESQGQPMAAGKTVANKVDN